MNNAFPITAGAAFGGKTAGEDRRDALSVFIWSLSDSPAAHLPPLTVCEGS